MRRVTGIRGIFFNANDPVALRAWNNQSVVIDVEEWEGIAFTWTDTAGILSRNLTANAGLNN